LMPIPIVCINLQISCFQNGANNFGPANRRLSRF
jgi:hypothetical protein